MRYVLCLLFTLITTVSFAGSQETTVGANGNSQPLPLNLVGWNPVGLLVTLSTNANLTCAVQVTGDGFNVRDSRGNPIPITHWNNHDTLINLTANGNGNIYFPVVAVRLVVTNWVSGDCTLAVIQVGP